jgi:hypothetical protein
LQRAGLHQPKAGGKKLRIIPGLQRKVGRWRQIRSGTGEAHGHHANLPRIARFAANLNVSYARNDLRHAHGNEHAVGARVAFVKNVRAANVRARRSNSGDEQQKECNKMHP